MGTRNLITIVHRGKFIIAQYGQWDGYPEGQGWDILKFLLVPGNIERLIKGLDFVKILQEDDLRSLAALNASDCQCEECTVARHKSLTRDAGAKILSLVADATAEKAVPVIHQLDFVNDTLFCEWAYCVDLDKRVFETYAGSMGGPKENNPESSRFHKIGDDDDPVPAFMKSYSLDDLPKDKESFSAAVYEAYRAKEKESSEKVDEELESDVDDEGDEDNDKSPNQSESKNDENGNQEEKDLAKDLSTLTIEKPGTEGPVSA